VPGGSLFEAPAVTFRGVLLLFAVLCAALPSAVQAAPGQVAPAGRQVNQGVAASPFGNPFSASRDPLAWQAWRQQVNEARRVSSLRANDASGGASGIVETIAGAAPFQKPVNALKTGLGEIQSVAEDNSGNLYVASCDMGVVLKVDSASNTTVYAGKPMPTGPAAASGDGGAATSARISCPSGIAIDSAGNLYISDINEGTVREVDAATGVIHTIAGIAGERDNTGDGRPATAAEVEDPGGLALDGAGNLFITDAGFIREVNLSTGIIQTIAGSDPAGAQCVLSATNTCPAAQVGMSLFGSTIVVFQNHLYAGLNSAYGGNNEVLRGAIVSINLSTGVMQLLAGGGAPAGTSSTYPGIGKSYSPLGLTADGSGNVYFTDISNLVYAFSASDHTVSVVAGSSATGYSGDGGPATLAALLGPQAICISPRGDVVFVDDFRIRSFAIGGNIATVAGNGFANYFGDGGLATQAGLDYPASIAADPAGNVYVADQENGVVRRIDGVTGVITTIAGGGAFGMVGDGGPAVEASLNPTSLALDPAGHLYVSSNGAIRVVDLKTNTISTLASGPASYGGMAFDGDKTLYITSGLSTMNSRGNSEVLAVDTTTGATSVIAGTAFSGNPTGDGGPAEQATLDDVRGVALDGKGTLFIADQLSNNIRSVDLSIGIIETAAGHAIFTPGSYGGDGGLAIDAFLAYPSGLAYDGAGHLIIADSGNNVLRQIDLSNNIITTLAGNHTAGFGGDGAAATGAAFYFPLAVAFDPSGNVIVADTYNNRVRRVVLHPTKLRVAIGVGGDFDTGGTVSVKASYSELAFGIAPTGTVTFSSGTTSLGSGTLAPATDGSGSYIATLTIPSLPAGVTSITAQYIGDENYAANTITIPLLQLTQSYTVSAKPASLTIQQGSSGSVTFTVTPENGFHQAVSFSCDSTTLPKGVTCSFSPASVTPDGTSAATTLTVTTTGASVAGLDRRATPFSGWLPRGGVVLALLLFGIPRVRRRAWLGGAALMLFALCITGMLGCGGGGSNSVRGNTQNANVTPPGSYSILVTTLAGSASGAAPATVSLTVTE
jgi:sugar lactone lactonase YvrE